MLKNTAVIISVLLAAASLVAFLKTDSIPFAGFSLIFGLYSIYLIKEKR